MRLLLCYVHPQTLASRQGCDYPLGEVSIFTEFTERYPADVDMKLLSWPEPKKRKAVTELRGGVGDTAIPAPAPNLVDALISHLEKSAEPALVLPCYRVGEANLERIVAFCLSNGHIPFICSEMMLSAHKRATDAYLWREMDKLVAKLRRQRLPAAASDCELKRAKSLILA